MRESDFDEFAMLQALQREAQRMEDGRYVLWAKVDSIMERSDDALWARVVGLVGGEWTRTYAKFGMIPLEDGSTKYKLLEVVEVL